ncbi:MAG: WG repeat-containing protein [Clostridia bacterium]|nr:WG repeat-containing protein [Clostridia bacterium]
MWRFKTVMVLAAIFIMVPIAAAGADSTFILSTSDSDMLVTMSGEFIIERGEYSQIIPLVESPSMGSIYTAYDSDGTISIIDAGGKVLSRGQYDSVYEMGDGVIYVVESSLTGAMDLDLNEILPCRYTQLVYNGTDGFLALSSDPYDERSDGVYFVGEDEVETATGAKVYYGLGTFYEGLMTVIDASNNRMGYLDGRGDWAIPSQYEYAGEFTGGAAIAALAAGSGFIDINGNWLVTPKYAQVSRSGESGIILVQENNSEIVLLDPETFSPIRTFTGEDIFFSAYYDMDIAIIYLDDCTLILNSAGETIMECGLDAEIDAWQEMGGRFVLRQGDWGEKCVWLCDMQGNRLTDAYQSIWHIGNDGDEALFACASFDVIDYVDVETAWHDRVAVDDSYSVDVVNSGGETVLSGLNCESLEYDECGALIYTTSSVTGAMDLSGNVIVEIEL